MKPLVSLHHASLQFGHRTLWDDVSLHVHAGEFLAVLGPNGSGKSSLLKVLLGINKLSAGTAHVGGRTGYIPQQKPFDKDTLLCGRDLVRFGLDGNEWGITALSTAQKTQLTAAIAEVGASQYANKPIGVLSGGEQQRLRIAQALVQQPQVLLCDEPLLSLDMASQQAVSNLINDRRKLGAAVVFVTHEINPILPMVDRVLYLVGGKWAIGTPDEILTTERLSDLYGAHVEVLRVHGRVVVVSTGDTLATEPLDAHHHMHEGTT
jgi:zinc/manganese transport system ATP-binding protein